LLLWLLCFAVVVLECEIGAVEIISTDEYTSGLEGAARGVGIIAIHNYHLRGISGHSFEANVWLCNSQHFAISSRLDPDCSAAGDQRIHCVLHGVEIAASIRGNHGVGSRANLRWR